MALRPETSLPKQPLPPEPLRVAFFGSPALALPTLEALLAVPELAQVVLVVTQPDRPSGRGLTLHAPPVAARARELGLPLLQPEKIRTGPFPAQLKAAAPDVAVVIAYGRILTTELLETPRFGCINVHASLLPRWRGAGPIQWSLIAGDAETGVTTMWMEEGLDTGPTLAVVREPIGIEDTAGSLGGRLAQQGARLLIETLKVLVSGRLTATSQPEDGATMAPLLTREDGRIRWEEAAPAVWNRIRGVTPGPGAWTVFRGGELKVTSARPHQGVSGRELAGTVLTADDTGLVVACGEGALEVLTVVPPGKRPMSGAEFVRGYKPTVGAPLA